MALLHRSDVVVAASLLLLAAAPVLLAGAGQAQRRSEMNGTTVERPAASALRKGAAEAQVPPRQDLGRIPATAVYRNAALSLGGVGLRNRGGGGIEISGAVGEIKAALLYWAVITEGPPGAAASSIDLRRDFPEPASGYRQVEGTAVGRGLSPCWLGDRLTVFRGILPDGLVRGNGQYSVRIRPGGNGRIDGSDPFAASPLPLFEGASLALVGEGTGIVAVYQRGLAGESFSEGLQYQLQLPQSAAGAEKVLFHSIGADGQSGVGTTPTRLTAAEVTRLGPGGPKIAGPGSRANEGQWNGATAGPLPQLWDTGTLDITTEVRQAEIGGVLPIHVSAPDDCLAPVAAFVEIR